jgi:putative glutamine amidotransferase
MERMRPLVGISCSSTRDRDGTPRFSVPQAYVRRVEAAGARAIVLPTVDPLAAESYVDLVDGVLLSGGADVDPGLYGADRHPEVKEVDRPRDDFEIALAREADAAGRPLLGICRGVQVMNVALGGTLVQHEPSHKVEAEDAHPVDVTAGTRLGRIVGATGFSVNSHHHQAIDRCAATLRVVARAPDGTVEAAESERHPFLVGVQWHPERLSDEPTRRLFAAFVEAAAKNRASRERDPRTLSAR